MCYKPGHFICSQHQATHFLTKHSFHDSFVQILKKEAHLLKSAATNSSFDMLHKIETIEKQVMDLKLSVLANLSPSGKNVISLKGILKGIDITEKDIATAKKSLYDKVKL